MDFWQTGKLALTAILANRLRSFLTVLGIVIGVTSVILLIAIVTGLKTFITSQIEGLGANLLVVIPGRIGGARSPGGVQANRLVYNDAVNLRAKLSSSAHISAVIQRNATLKSGNKTDKGAAVFGVEANFPQTVSITLTSGRFFRAPEQQSLRKVVVIGPTVKTNLLLGANPIGKKIDVAGIKYAVIGVLASRGSIFGIDQDNSIYIPFSSAQKQFGI
ncbi:MAG: ABC transporter permease, partial [Patescibacteria group bacterium]